MTKTKKKLKTVIIHIRFSKYVISLIKNYAAVIPNRKTARLRHGLEVIKNSYSTKLSMNFFPLVNVKMPTLVGILTFMNRKNSNLGIKKLNVLTFFILISIKNFNAQLSLA